MRISACESGRICRLSDPRPINSANFPTEHECFTLYSYEYGSGTVHFKIRMIIVGTGRKKIRIK